MNKIFIYLFRKIILLLVGNLLSLTSYCQSKPNSISSLKFIGQYEIPFNTIFKNTIVGGLSGIDYDESRNLYYLVSDDRSEKNDARFYTARILFSEKGIDSVQLKNAIKFRQPNGLVYPGSRINPLLTPDPESIRYNKLNDELVWVSEGERKLGEDTVLITPSLQTIGTDGRYKSSFTLPPNLTMSTKESGPRQNGTLEGLSFSDDFISLYISMEEPLYQDGPKAGLEETNSFIRIYKFDTRSKINTAQYAYKLDKVAYPPIPSDGFKINGVSDILYTDLNHLLVIERSSSAGKNSFSIKIYLADFSQAENIIECGSLIKRPPKRSASKQLLLNMDDLNMYIDNIEGLTFGPTLPNGHKTLLFVADNNFKPDEKNQFLFFEVIP